MIRKLYHGSDKYFEIPDLTKARNFKDFGRGFYLTTNAAQAGKWAIRKISNSDRTQVAYLYEYVFQCDNLEDLKILELLECNKEWLECISCYRTVLEETIEYDLIYDRIADGYFKELTGILREYRSGKRSLEETLAVVNWKHSDGDQYCFKTSRALQKIARKRYAEVYNSNGIPRILKWYNGEVKAHG